MTTVFNESLHSCIIEITSCPEPRGILKDQAAVGAVDRFGHDISTEIAKDLEKESIKDQRPALGRHTLTQTNACIYADGYTILNNTFYAFPYP